MKRWVAFLFVVMMLVPLAAFADDIPHITYEQMMSGDFDGQTVEIDGMYYYASFYVQKEDGKYKCENTKRWVIYNNTIESATADAQRALENREPLIMVVELDRDDDIATIIDFRPRGTLSKEQESSQVACFLVGFFVLIIVIAVWHCKRLRDNPPPPKPYAIKTKYIDSSHTASSQTKTGSAAGRAIVGGMIAGPIGAMVGAGTAKQQITEHHTTTFMVYYNDGTHRAETVENDTRKYREYMQILDLE